MLVQDWLNNHLLRSGMAQVICLAVSWLDKEAKAHQVLLHHHNNPINKVHHINKCPNLALRNLHLKHHRSKVEDTLDRLKTGIQETHHLNQQPHLAQAKAHA